MCAKVREKVRDLTVMCLEGLWFHHLTAMAAHDQVEVILSRTLAKYGHVCEFKWERENRKEIQICNVIFTGIKQCQLYFLQLS